MKAEGKKRLLQINVCCGVRSTGRIVAEIAQEYEQQGWECRIAYGRLEVPEKYQKYAVRIGSQMDCYAHGAASMLLDAQGLASRGATRKFLQWADEFAPDVLWLHVIHGHYINYEMLFAWIKTRPQMKVYWTFHDCWAFTGHCCYFDTEGCEKWKTGCHACTLQRIYPKNFGIDRSQTNYERKKTAFTGVQDMTIICPSQWQADLTKQSFLGMYPVEVRHNRVDLSDFVPTPGDFREKAGLKDARLILGVASSWDWRKGLQDYVALAKRLDESYAVVVVGLTARQISQLCKAQEGEAETLDGNGRILRTPGQATLVCLLKTHNVHELAALYTTADIYANLSYEENYPTTNLEAAACGTEVITYRTGGSPESVKPENVVEKGNLEQLTRRICELLEVRG